MLRSILQSIEPVLFLDYPLSQETNLVLFAGWEDPLLFQSLGAYLGAGEESVRTSILTKVSFLLRASYP